jgi:hypothetical protein
MRAIDIGCVAVVGAAVAWWLAAGRSNRSRLAAVVIGGSANGARGA